MNKGFTLVETIMSIVILSIVMLIAMPAYNGISFLIREQNYNSKLKSIEAAMLKYANVHLLDEVRKENCQNSPDGCGLSFELEDMLAYGIIQAEEYDDEGNGYINNPMKNDVLKGKVNLTLDVNTAKLNAEFIVED